MSKQNLNYEDGIPEEILWNPETNSFMNLCFRGNGYQPESRFGMRIIPSINIDRGVTVPIRRR